MARLTTSACLRLDVRALARGGHLEGRTPSAWRWTRGSELLGEVQTTPGPGGLTLAHGGRAYVVPVEREPLPFGGSRPWFRCPARGCGRRCAVLYLRGVWACRTCQRLAYPSTRLQEGDRLACKVARLLHRLGAERGTDPLFARKPPRMWWRTYEELVRRARVAERERLQAWTAHSEAWLDRMERQVAG